ncbi:MAG TPA: DUF421 domain-containing protein [Firmicutes bacterium]|nr:DUF421 domain-containing protein [Bacillota bacterium]
MSSVLASTLLALLFYVVILVAFKLLGKRELNQLSSMDIVMNILIANIAASGIVDEAFWLDALAGVVVIVIVQILVAKLQITKNKLRDLIDAEPSMVIKHGTIDYEELKKLRIDLDDFVMLLRENNVVSVEDVQYALIERNGKLTVYKKQMPTSVFPLPLVISGTIKQEALKSLGKSEDWLRQELEHHQMHDLKKIELLFYEENKFTIYCQRQMKKIKLSSHSS